MLFLKFHWFLRAFILVNLSFLLAACARNSSPTASSTPTLPRSSNELTIWAWGAGLKGLQVTLNNFSQLQPELKITLVPISPPEIYQKLDAGLLAGGVGAPDLVEIETERLDFFTAKYPEGFTDLKSWAAKYEGQFQALQWGLVQRIGRTRALPWFSGPVGLFIRADLFEAAGIKASTIATWDDFLKVGRQLQLTFPNLKALVLNPQEDALLRSLMEEQGVSYFSPEGKINLAAPEAVRALTLIKKLYAENFLLTVNSPAKLISALREGQAAAYLAGVSFVPILEEMVPEMAGKWEVIPLPAIGATDNHTANLGGAVLALLRTSKNPEAGAAFMEYALANKVNQNIMLSQAGLLPSFLPAYESDIYASSRPFFNQKPFWQFFASEARRMNTSYFTKDFVLASDGASIAQLLSLIKLDPGQALQKKANDLKDATGRELNKPVEVKT